MPDAPDQIQLLTGHQAVREALRARRRPLYRLLVARDAEAGELLGLAREAGLSAFRVTSAELGNLTRNSKHQGVVLECGPLPEYPLDELLRFSPPGGDDLLVLLDSVEDPHNLGAIARSAFFFGARALIFPLHGAAPASPAASRASAGALESLPLARVTRASRAAEKLAQAGYRLLGVELGGEPLGGLPPAEAGGKVALALGGEDKGVSRGVAERCDRVLSIGGSGVGSLNVSVAAGIALHHLATLRRAITP